MNPVLANLISGAIEALAVGVAAGGTAFLQTHITVDSIVVGAVAAAVAIVQPQVRAGIVTTVQQARGTLPASK